MRRLILLSAALCAVAGPMQAASRFYCAADDEHIRLTVDTGFADSPGHKLNHFRGALITKASDAPADFKTLMLDSSQLTQNWSYDGDLRLNVAARGQGEDGDKSFELVLMASGKDETAPMVGSYVLTFTAAPDVSAPLQYKGRMTCNAK